MIEGRAALARLREGNRRFVANVRVVTFKDVNIEELAGKDL